MDFFCHSLEETFFYGALEVGLIAQIDYTLTHRWLIEVAKVALEFKKKTKQQTERPCARRLESVLLLLTHGGEQRVVNQGHVASTRGRENRTFIFLNLQHT